MLLSGRLSTSCFNLSKSPCFISSASAAFSAFASTISCAAFAHALRRISSRSVYHLSRSATHLRALYGISCAAANFLCEMFPPMYSFLIANQSIFLSIANHPLFVYKHSYLSQPNLEMFFIKFFFWSACCHLIASAYFYCRFPCKVFISRNNYVAIVWVEFTHIAPAV